MNVGVRITSTSPLQGASLFECPGCGYHFEITYDIAKKRHSDGADSA